MSLFKRLSTTVVIGLERVVDQLENHDAVLQAALADMQRKVAQARVRCNRLRGEGEILGEQLAARRRKAAQWRRLAVQAGRHNEARALECLARARATEREIETLERRRREYTEAATKLETAIASLAERAGELRRQQMLLRARESAGEVLSAAALDGQCGGGLDQLLERWEVKVVETELAADIAPVDDELEQSFAARELEEELRAELTVLLEGEESHHDR